MLLLATLAVGSTYWLLAPSLPSVAALKDYHMQVPLRVLSAGGKLIAIFGKDRRIPVSIAQVPSVLKHAVLSAEDADFYHHPGVDLYSVLRAAWHVILAGGKKVQGGSTITQQLARKIFLSPQKLYSRKLIEMFTAMRIEKELSKDQILELYLNKMFLGHRAYGVAAAANYYYGKKLKQLSIAQCAAIAASFQLPSAINPISNPRHLLVRRNWVLGQMLEHRYINQSQYQRAIATPDDASPHEQPIQVKAPYLAEMVRQDIIQRFGDDALSKGYVVKTTIDSRLQLDAVHALRKNLVAYDHRHGWRGPEAHLALPHPFYGGKLDALLSGYHTAANMQPGIVTKVMNETVTVYLKHAHKVKLQMAAMRWARPYIDANHIGPAPRSVHQLLRPGDIVRLVHGSKGQWKLAQIPKVQAALVSIHPEDGSIKALVGGFSFSQSKFNRASMARRQPGSSFKPYFYSAALVDGFTPASIINDAPLALSDPARKGGLWTPSDDARQFSGPMRLRQALVHSKNLVSIRLLEAIGTTYARTFSTRFGFSLAALPNNLSLALGTASVSPLDMVRGYAVFANGGYLVTPYFIQEIDNSDNKAVYIANPARACRNCKVRLLNPTPAAPPAAGMPGMPANRLASAMPSAAVSAIQAESNPSASNQALNPVISAQTKLQPPVLAPHVLDIRTDYLITSLLKDVILHGTGWAARALNRPDLAGKTGTSNDNRDSWFLGFGGRLTTAVWAGFDNFSSLGKHEYGSTIALPIWMAYMGSAPKGSAENSLPMPPGISTALINRHTGLPTSIGDPDAISETFKVENLDKLRARASQRQQPQQHALNIF